MKKQSSISLFLTILICMILILKSLPEIDSNVYSTGVDNIHINCGGCLIPISSHLAIDCPNS